MQTLATARLEEKRASSFTQAPPQMQTRKTPRLQEKRASSFTQVNVGVSGSLPLEPGDVLCVKGSPEGIASLGATGGFMGHVLLVVSAPRSVTRQAPEAGQFFHIWPRDARMLWIVRTRESCRAVEGFHESEQVLYADARGRIRLIAELAQDHLAIFDRVEVVELFCCPPELRKLVRLDVVHDVLETMRDFEASWSWGTAIRAYLLSADLGECHASSANEKLKEIRNCWKADPICTSVVIVFWQKYFCRLAQLHRERHALDWIMEWMPVKSDRALPGELLQAMARCGWNIMGTSQEGRVRARSF
jgi:hypothetical protein